MTRPRRDPRAERAALAETVGERVRIVRGAARSAPAAGRKRRRDPRAERLAALRTGPRPRLDWTRDAGSVPAAATTTTATATGQAVAQASVRTVESPAFLVFAVLDQPDGELGEHDRQVLGAARLLADGGGGAVVAFSLGGGADLGACGADRVVALPQDWASRYCPEERTAAVVAAMAAWSPRHVLFPESPAGGDVARRTAVATGERLFPGVQSLSAGKAARRSRGGSAELSHAVPRLLSIEADAFAPMDDERHEARPLEPPPFAARPKLRDARRLPVDPDRLPLAEADFLLSAGNGVTDWPAFTELAEVLGATRAGSRIVCDAGHLPRERQVGASGTVVTARCYLAFGIAGAPQHLQGITEVKHVIAINTDLHAEMIKRADLAIVADAQEVMPALVRHARERRHD
ncbi:MAG TPA: electron transfer flavoprotein subunit alpha/FixB family protein [Arenibaculum sp.]|nr:electron transfer flavoprotein subunit alpha/FixB family protein [Arenibaculum sp.]